MLLRNQKGQAGAVFKILIGAIVGLVIFAIIFALINMTKEQEEYLVEEVFYKQLEMGINNPTGEEYIISDVRFQEERSINKMMLSYKTGLHQDCFTFNETGVSVIKNISSDEDIIGYKFNKSLEVDVIIKCDIADFNDKCPVNCDLNIIR